MGRRSLGGHGPGDVIATVTQTLPFGARVHASIGVLVATKHRASLNG